MSAHTPGPWKAERGTGRYSDRHYVVASHYSTPTVVSGKDQIVQLTSHHDDHEAEVIANARLIAAAPDMLAALQNIENDGKQVPDHAWALIQGAIAKATGDESDCPGHVASDADPKVCGRCGTHIDSLRPEGGAA